MPSTTSLSMDSNASASNDKLLWCSTADKVPLNTANTALAFQPAKCHFILLYSTTRLGEGSWIMPNTLSTLGCCSFLDHRPINRPERGLTVTPGFKRHGSIYRKTASNVRHRFDASVKREVREADCLALENTKAK